jgi:hypothetical protein
MDRVPVSSTDVASIGYDLDSQTLEVEFNSGGIYQYFQVSRGTYEEFINASSKGKYLHLNIKNRYSYSRVG